MGYSIKSKTKSSKAGKKPFKPCRGCPTKAACTRAKKCKGKKK